MLRLFGFTILSPKELEDSATRKTPSVVIPPNEQGATTVYEGGVGSFGNYAINFNDFVGYESEVTLINKYRSLALQPEIDEAISDIIHEMIIQEDDKLPVSINLGKLPKVYNKDFKKKVADEFSFVLELLDFGNKAYDIARQFYVDGRLYYDLVIDETDVSKGVVEVRNIDPRVIKPVREVKEYIHPETGARISEIVQEYFIFNPNGVQNMGMDGSIAAAVGAAGSKITKDRVAYVNSGIYTPGNVQVLSHIHKAIKPFNQLRMVEDATVIYRISRAPERRVFYIDVGDLPTAKAEAYLNSVATKYRNRMVYNTNDGQVTDDRKVQSMLEDFFLPRRGTTGKSSEVTTLPGGQNLGEMEDVEYFKRKLYRSLNIPLSRIEKDGGTFQLGRVAEISRDEIKFSRFLVRLRERLAMVFDEVLAKHLTLKGIIKSPNQWYELRRYIAYDFISDSHFSELKEMEVLSARLDAAAKLDPYIGRYYSDQYVRDHILKQTPEEQELIDAALKKDPEQIPAMVVPKSADGMRPANPEAYGGDPGFGGFGGGDFGNDPSAVAKPGFGAPKAAPKAAKAEKAEKAPKAKASVKEAFDELNQFGTMITESEDGDIDIVLTEDALDAEMASEIEIL